MENIKNFEKPEILPLSQEEFDELINLRKKQVGDIRLTPEESAKLKALETRFKLYGKVGEEEIKRHPLSSAEYEEFLNLTKCQTKGISPINPNEKWEPTAPYATRVGELYSRLEKYGKVD